MDNDKSVMSITSKLVQEFTNLADMNKDYSLNELKALLSDVYKAQVPKKKPVSKKDPNECDNDEPKKKGRPMKIKLNNDGTVKQKKAPSAYNIFVKGKCAELKALNPDKKAPEIMSLAAAAWKMLSEEEKEAFKTKINDDKVEDKENTANVEIKKEEVKVEIKKEEVKVDSVKEEVKKVEINKEEVDNTIQGDLPTIEKPAKKKVVNKKTTNKKGKSKENTFINDDDDSS